MICTQRAFLTCLMTFLTANSTTYLAPCAELAFSYVTQLFGYQQTSSGNLLARIDSIASVCQQSGLERTCMPSLVSAKLPQLYLEF